MAASSAQIVGGTYVPPELEAAEPQKQPSGEVCKHCGGSGTVTDTENVEWPCPNKCNQDAPQEQQSDAYDYYGGENPPNRALYIQTAAHGLNMVVGEDMKRLIDYGRSCWQLGQMSVTPDAPQAEEDAKPFAWAIDYKDGRRVFTDDEAFVTSDINQSIREQRGDKVTRLFATPQPAGRDAREVPDEP